MDKYQRKLIEEMNRGPTVSFGRPIGYRVTGILESNYHPDARLEPFAVTVDSANGNIIWCREWLLEFTSKCERCGKEVYIPPGDNICGNCADDLRDEQDAAMADAEILGLEAQADLERERQDMLKEMHQEDEYANQ